MSDHDDEIGQEMRERERTPRRDPVTGEWSDEPPCQDHERGEHTCINCGFPATP